MADRITKDKLKRLVVYLNKITNSPSEAYTKTATGLKPNAGHYSLDSAYGGYALVQMSAGGGERNVLERGSTRDIYERIYSYVKGIEQCAGGTYKDNPRPSKKKKSTRRKSRSRFSHEDIRSPSKMVRGSIRTKTVRGKRGKVKAEIRVGCPKPKSNYNRRTGKCKVGTRAVSILRPNPKPKTFRVFTRVKEKGKLRYAYLTPEKSFDTNFNHAELFYRDTAILKAKGLHKRYPQYPFGVSDGKA